MWHEEEEEEEEEVGFLSFSSKTRRERIPGRRGGEERGGGFT